MECPNSYLLLQPCSMDQDGHFDPSIDTLLTKVYRSWWTFFFWVLTICIGSFFIGYTNKLTAIYSEEKDVQYGELVLTSGSYPIFAFLGVLSCYILVKRISQRFALCIAGGIGIIGCLVLYVSNLELSNGNIALKLIGKGIEGFAGGIFSVYCPIIIKDIVPIEESVTFGSFHQFSIVFGLLISKLFDLLVLNHGHTSHSHLPILIPIPFLILMIALILFCYKTQTAKYLIQNKKIDEAKELIDKLYRDSVAEQIYLEIEHSVNAMDNSYFQGEYDMKIIRRRITIIGIGVAIIQQISGASIVNTYGLYPYDKQHNGIESRRKNIVFGITWCSIQIGMVIVLMILNSIRNIYNRDMKFIKIISKRRNLFRIGISITIILLAAIVVTSAVQIGKEKDSAKYFSDLASILYVFAANYGLTLGPMTWIYLSQISNTFEMISALLASWLFSLITVALLPKMPGLVSQEVFNLSSGLLTLAILNVVFLFLTHKYLVQTKYKSDIQIYRQLSSLSFSNCSCRNNDQQQRLNN